MVGYQPSKPISGADAFRLVGFLGVLGSGGSERGAGLLVPALFSACEGRAPSLLSALVSCPALPLVPPSLFLLGGEVSASSVCSAAWAPLLGCIWTI